MNRLLNESWIEGLPDNIVENLEDLNRYVVRRICERIREIGDIGTSDANRLMSVIEYAGADLGAIEREISCIMRMNRAEVQRLFEEVAAENIDFANTYYAARGMEELRTYRNRANLTAFVESAKRAAMDGTANLSHTYMIGFKRGRQVVPLREYYIAAVDRAVTFVRTGTVDYQTAMRSTVRDMARSGLRRVTFDSGYSRRLDSQARMNILEGVRRLNADMMEETGKEFGADGVEISVHGLCAPDHQSIQGRQYSNREYERLNERLQRPIGTLNCHHFATPIILGISKPVHSARELEEINARSNAPVEYRGRTMTRYEASQEQRQLETAIRYAKDERDAYAAAGDKIGAAQARKRSAALGREYKSFCEQAGLTPRPERTRSMTGPTVERIKGLKSVEKRTEYRYNGDGTIVVTHDLTGISHPRLSPQMEPFSVVETISQSGRQTDRTYYGKDGAMEKQISSGPHGNPKRHPFGEHGEHAHDIIWKDGKIVDRPARDLTDAERKENGDIL